MISPERKLHWHPNLKKYTALRYKHRYMHPIQKKIFKEMSPAKKLELSAQLYYSARELKTAAVRQEHPSWSEEKVNKKVREIFLYARS